MRVSGAGPTSSCWTPTPAWAPLCGQAQPLQATDQGGYRAAGRGGPWRCGGRRPEPGAGPARPTVARTVSPCPFEWGGLRGYDLLGPTPRRSGRATVRDAGGLRGGADRGRLPRHGARARRAHDPRRGRSRRGVASASPRAATPARSWWPGSTRAGATCPGTCAASCSGRRQRGPGFTGCPRKTGRGRRRSPKEGTAMTSRPVRQHREGARAVDQRRSVSPARMGGPWLCGPGG